MTKDGLGSTGDQGGTRAERAVDIQANDRLGRERLLAMRLSMSVFAHEVGNQLNNLFLQAQMLERGLRKEDHPQLARAQSIVRQVERLGATLDELRAQPRAHDRERQSVDLAAIIRELVQGELASEAGTGIRVDHELSASPVCVWAQREELQQVVLHLCRNALEAMPDGGRLSIRLRHDDGVAKLAVQDTGSGVPADIDVFKPFHTAKDGHLGLGLAMVRHIVKAHGGSIRYESHVDQGTTFTVTLPAG